MGFGAVGLGETSRMPVTRDIQQLAGSFSTGQLADVIDDALRRARERGVGETLVDITEVTGFRSPGPGYRRWVARRWAATVNG